MSLLVVQVSPDQPREDRLVPALTTLREGGLVALPTETFYGLAANPFDRAALGRLNRLKGKPADSPHLLLLSDVAQLQRVCNAPPELLFELAERFWPGPLTMVVPASDEVPDEVSGGRGTVAVRVPGLALPRRLAALLPGPLTGVSANRHGCPPGRTAGEVARAFPEGVDLILDGGPTTGGAPSTLLDLCGTRPRLLREGAVPRSLLAAFVEELEVEE